MMEEEPNERFAIWPYIEYMMIATFGDDISRFGRLLVIGGIDGEDWTGGVVGDLGPFVGFPLSRFSVSSVKLDFCFLFGKHMGKEELW